MKFKIPIYTDTLYKAVDSYVSNLGGKLIMIFGVEVQEWPQDAKGLFRLAIKCGGIKPKYAEPK